MKSLRGSKLLFAYLLRQYRLRLSLWIIGILIVTLSVAAGYPSMYPDEAAREAFAITMENPVMIAMLGIGYEEYATLGSLFAMEMLLFSSIAVAIMNILYVSKATRSDEEEGRVELIRALSTGKLSYLHTTMVIMFLANIALFIIISGGLLILNIEGMSTEGCLLYGALLGGTGLFFGALAAVISQLVETSRSASLLSFAGLIIAYLIRAIGDVNVEGLSYLSPLGWVVRSEVFVQDKWWPVGIFIGAFIVLIFVAYYLQFIRDMEAGFIPERKGKAHASPLLITKLGFVFRLQRTMIISWFIAILLLSASFAAILGDLEIFIAENEFIQSFLSGNGSLVNEFIVLFMAIMAIFISIPAVMVILRLKGEENRQLTEPIYSRAWSKLQVVGTYTLISICISIVFSFVMSVLFWLIGTNMMDGELLSLGEVISASMVYVPAIIMVIGITIFLLGVLPKWTSFIWVFVTYGFVVLYFADLLDLPEWARNLSIYEHIPAYPNEEIAVGNILTYCVVALALIVIGFFGYRKRDIRG